ncbi:hypothetical protein CCP3SC15_1010002 [Gammaproteobacteria bacterium]
MVEGFTDIDGSYLFNLDLSLKRAQNVVCSLLREVADSATVAPSRLRSITIVKSWMNCGH